MNRNLKNLSTGDSCVTLACPTGMILLRQENSTWDATGIPVHTHWDVLTVLWLVLSGMHRDGCPTMGWLCPAIYVYMHACMYVCIYIFPASFSLSMVLPVHPGPSRPSQFCTHTGSTGTGTGTWILILALFTASTISRTHLLCKCCLDVKLLTSLGGLYVLHSHMRSIFSHNALIAIS